MKFFIFVVNSERFWPKTSFIEALFSRSDKLKVYTNVDPVFRYSGGLNKLSNIIIVRAFCACYK